MHRIHHQYMRHKNNYWRHNVVGHAVWDLRKSGELTATCGFDDKKGSGYFDAPLCRCSSIRSLPSSSVIHLKCSKHLLSMSIVGNRWHDRAVVG